MTGLTKSLVLVSVTLTAASLFAGADAPPLVVGAASIYFTESKYILASGFKI